MDSSFQRQRSAAVLLLLGSLVLAGCGTIAPSSAPTTTAPPAASPAPSPAPTKAPSPAKSTTAAAGRTAIVPSPARPAPAPVSVAVPSIGVQSPVVKLKLRANGSLEVPPDGPGAPAGWYSGSPSPGETGPAVFLGHVNATDGGPGVFANLRGLKTGAEIRVQRADKSAAVFTVTRAAAYRKNDFPTFEVYGNTKGPELRLITCDGYDPATGLFNDNYVVYAKLKSAG
ncbi:class F sortase [Arthrobacter sp. UC242_113]|uniref:class F sortase n=1 Tax=Arthrobacter sp. UC242_113 TaxID=3374550 RepID=UPI003756FE47